MLGIALPDTVLAEIDVKPGHDRNNVLGAIQFDLHRKVVLPSWGRSDSSGGRRSSSQLDFETITEISVVVRGAGTQDSRRL